MCTFVHAYVHTFFCLIHIHIHHVYVCIYSVFGKSAYRCMYFGISANAYINVYICVCTYICMYTYIYIRATISVISQDLYTHKIFGLAGVRRIHPSRALRAPFAARLHKTAIEPSSRSWRCRS